MTITLPMIATGRGIIRAASLLRFGDVAAVRIYCPKLRDAADVAAHLGLHALRPDGCSRRYVEIRRRPASSVATRRNRPRPVDLPATPRG